MNHIASHSNYSSASSYSSPLPITELPLHEVMRYGPQGSLQLSTDETVTVLGALCVHLEGQAAASEAAKRPEAAKHLRRVADRLRDRAQKCAAALQESVSTAGITT